MENGNWSFIGNPTECSLLAAAAKAGVDYQKLRHEADVVRVFPFSSQNKDMSTIARENGKDILYVKGNPEKIISLCSGISDEEKERANDYDSRDEDIITVTLEEDYEK